MAHRFCDIADSRCGWWTKMTVMIMMMMMVIRFVTRSEVANASVSVSGSNSFTEMFISCGYMQVQCTLRRFGTGQQTKLFEKFAYDCRLHCVSSFMKFKSSVNENCMHTLYTSFSEVSWKIFWSHASVKVVLYVALRLRLGRYAGV